MTFDITSSDFDETVLRRLDLNLLVVFAMVMRHGSVQAAANRLYLGSSGVSMALARLREATGDQLFGRGKRGLEPTAFARTLFDAVSPALSAIGEAMNPAAFDPRSASGTVRVALSDDLEIVFAARLQRALTERAPNLRLAIRHGDYRRVSMLLHEDSADLVITAEPASLDRRHRSDRLYTEHFLVLAGRSRGKALDLNTYLEAPHALVSASGSMRGRLDEVLAELGRERHVQVVSESFAALPFLVAGSDLVATVPASTARILAARFDLALYELPIESPTFPVALSWRARDANVSAQAWLRELITDLLRREG